MRSNRMNVNKESFTNFYFILFWQKYAKLQFIRSDKFYMMVDGG